MYCLLEECSYKDISNTFLILTIFSIVMVILVCLSEKK
jgi:hypothetical protein